MSTLKTLIGVEWFTLKHNGRIAYQHSGHGICFNSADKLWQVMTAGRVIFSSKDISSCLEEGSRIVLDSYASRFKPSWEE